PVAVACLTVFFITHLLGIEGAAKLEIVMDIVLALAMTCCIVFGLPKVDYSTLFTVDFAPAGPMGIITCAVLLTWGRSLVGFLASALRLTMSMPPAVAQVS
ncbi:amino acid permease, partial [Flavonifractor plautii]|nr:amino acid permease [Flavonifractor plautii]